MESRLGSHRQVAGRLEDEVLIGSVLYAAGQAMLWARALAPTPSTTLCNIAVSACARATQLSRAQQLLDWLCARGRPDVQSFNSLMTKAGAGWELDLRPRS